MSKIKRLYEPVTFSESNGILHLHFGTPWIQGAMKIKKPDELFLEYAQQMMGWLLFLDPNLPKFKCLQLGLGTGSITKFTQKLNKTIQSTAVELNPAVIIASQTMFGLNTMDKRLNVVQGNALNFVLDINNNLQFDVMAVDIYNGQASGPALSSKKFYDGCYRTLKETGVLTVNLFSRHSSYEKNIHNLCNAFNDRVLLFKEVHDFNVVAIAFKGPHLEVSWRDLVKRANYVQQEWKLPAKKWVKSLKDNNLQDKKNLSI